MRNISDRSFSEICIPLRICKKDIKNELAKQPTFREIHRCKGQKEFLFDDRKHTPAHRE